MLDHAFGTLGLHRIALYVFEFNERAIHAYRRAGFSVEGRSRESIWRDDRWWDELAMSVLESDWRARRDAGTVAPTAAAPEKAATLDDVGAGGEITSLPSPESVGAGASDRLRRTFGRWR
jgi:hypothetical protein